jgi:putative DNA-invertase from lambdoid prophage Rac
MASNTQAVNDNRRAIAYCRVSTDDQKNGIDVQRRDIANYARANGIEVVAEFVDFGVSGGADLEDRPELMAAIDALATEKAGILLVGKRDRLARSILHACIIEDECRKNGALVHSTDGNNDDTPEAKMMRTILDAFAEFERAKIKMRTRATKAKQKEEGLYLGGKVPFGYKVEDGMLVVDTQQHAARDRALVLKSQGLSIRKICAALTDEGYAHPCGNWSVSTVHRMTAEA